MLIHTRRTVDLGIKVRKGLEHSVPYIRKNLCQNEDAVLGELEKKRTIGKGRNVRGDRVMKAGAKGTPGRRDSGGQWSRVSVMPKGSQRK